MIRFLIFLSFTAAAARAAVPFTLEQALSAPFPSNLVSNGRGRVAWVANDRGVRNIWVAEAPSYRARRITANTEDDGMEISDLRISADGTTLVYTRGEGANAQNEFPNPDHLLAGVEQTIQSVAFADGSAKQLGRGHSPAFSPDSKNVAFLSAGQVWMTLLNGGGSAMQVTHQRGKASELAWSPDSRSLAFTSTRELHSLIAVYRVGADRLQFLDPGSDFDGSAVWSPDSQHIAFKRIPSTLDWNMHEPRRAAATPWSIRVADMNSARGHEIWKASAGPGSVFRGTASGSQLFWAAGDRIVFPWEQTGWLHLYSMSVQGAAPSDLTPDGDETAGEVEEAMLSPDGAELVYSSNRGDIDRRHVYRVRIGVANSLRGVARHALEWSPVFAAPDEIAILHSDADQPARAAIVRSEVVDLAPETVRNDFPVAKLSAIRLTADDGIEIHGQLFLPPDDTGKHPAVIFIHGGSRRQMLLGWHPMFYYNQAYAFNRYLASKGYVVLSVNYRSGIGYGLNFREALDYGPSGGSEYRDIVAAGRYLQSRKDVNSNKIGLWGGSYGGYLTALGLARNSELFAAGVDLHGVHNWNDEMEDSLPVDQLEERRKLEATALRSSPLAYIDSWRSPVLLIQGDDDRDVNFRQTEIMVEALRKQHVPFEELIFPDEIHDFLMHRHWMEAYAAAETFLGKYLTK